MRVGKSPARYLRNLPVPGDVTVAVMVHIPFLAGYHESSLDVLRLSLTSVLRNTDAPFDLMVFDNGSCKQVQDYLVKLKEDGHIRYLVLSHENIGKIAAWNFMFQAAPGKYIAYSDYDVFYHPGWLAEHVKILEAFPDVCTVTGFPHRRVPDYYSSTIERAEADPEIEVDKGHFIPKEWIDEFVSSLGISLEKYHEKIADVLDVRLQSNGACAYASSGHFQFVAPATALRGLMPFGDSAARGQGDDTPPRHSDMVISFDEAINAAGYLRLSTTERYVEHMGNTLTPARLDLARSFGLPSGQAQRKDGLASRLLRRPAQWRPVRAALLKLYCAVFSLLK